LLGAGYSLLFKVILRTNHQGSRREKLNFFSLLCTPKPPELGIDEKENAATTREIQPSAHQLQVVYMVVLGMAYLIIENHVLAEHHSHIRPD